MKTIVLLMFVSCLSFTSFSQNKFAIKPLPRIEFDDFNQQQQPDYLTVSPQLKLEDELPQSFFDDNTENSLDNSYLKSTTDVFTALGDNMPVAVPDSTNMYFIKEKRFGGGPSKLP